MIQYPNIPISTTGATTITHVNAYPDTQTVVIYNESPYYLNVTLVGSGIMGIPAYTADVQQIFSGFTGNIQITPVTYLTTTNSSPPSSVAFIQTYGSNDLLTKNIQNGVSTGYPMPLVRQVSSDVSNATNVTNVGYPAGQTIVFGQPVGDTGSPTSLSNNGVLDLGDSQNDALIFLTGTLGYLTFMHSNALGVQDASSNLVFSYDQHGNVICANGQTEFTYGTGNETHIVNLQGSDISFQSPINTEIGRFTNAGTVKLPAKSVSVSGQTSGTCTIYQDCSGTIKRTWIYFNNYKNSATQTLAFPFAYTVGALVQVGQTNGNVLSFLHSGSAQNMQVISSLNNASASTTIKQWSTGEIEGPFDTFQIGIGATVAYNGQVEITGQ